MVSDVDGRELTLGWNSQYQLTSVDSVSSSGVGGKISYDYNIEYTLVHFHSVSSSVHSVYSVFEYSCYGSNKNCIGLPDCHFTAFCCSR